MCSELLRYKFCVNILGSTIGDFTNLASLLESSELNWPGLVVSTNAEIIAARGTVPEKRYAGQSQVEKIKSK